MSVDEGAERQSVPERRGHVGDGNVPVSLTPDPAPLLQRFHGRHPGARRTDTAEESPNCRLLLLPPPPAAAASPAAAAAAASFSSDFTQQQQKFMKFQISPDTLVPDTDTEQRCVGVRVSAGEGNTPPPPRPPQTKGGGKTWVTLQGSRDFFPPCFVSFSLWLCVE